MVFGGGGVGGAGAARALHLGQSLWDLAPAGSHVRW
jgi:hypothetical protein